MLKAELEHAIRHVSNFDEQMMYYGTLTSVKVFFYPPNICLEFGWKGENNKE